ncbi:NADPh quinone reductase [Lunasporangiospora selenospora]|uniref:NADPh quinone reductase n=1 Tax=Lunasporangiospora selenospora TaxID=979761 RepID=A0A9P6FX84_9FUNG|nr:NADPh quinone reductase [Lunasporangiospora selenospora]
MATYANDLPKTFTAIQYKGSGSPRDIFTVNDKLPLPKVTGSKVLIKVHAAAINPVDWKLMLGGPVRWTMPSVVVPGLDISGTIVALGPQVGKNASLTSSRGELHLGDEILSFLSPLYTGALQEYVVVDESLLVKKPKRWSFEQAAAWPLVAVTIWESLVVRGKIKKGDKVLVMGASGGTGTVAVQFAKAMGAYVVGVCSTANLQFVKDLGADEVVDYKTTNVTTVYTNRDFDIILETVGDESAAEIWAHNKTILKCSGNLVRIAADDRAMSSVPYLLMAGAHIVSKKVYSFLTFGPGYHLFTTMPDGDALAKVIKVLDQDGHADPAIDSEFDFSLPSVLKAFDRSISHRARGKIVIKLV